MIGWFKRSSPEPGGEGFETVIARMDGEIDTKAKPLPLSHAIDVTTVLACADAIATGCAMPDLHVMRLDANGRAERATDVKAYRALHRRPNEWQTAMEFRETLTLHAALTGNAFAIPTRNARGDLLEMWPVLPQQVTIEHTGRYDLRYIVHDDFGRLGVFGPSEIFHLRNRSWDRIKGLDAVRQARGAIGLSLAAESNVTALQRRAGKAGGLLVTDQKMSKDAMMRLKEQWKTATSGDRVYGTPVLDGGLDYKAVAMTAVDQQTLETRRQQVEEICRGFGVFPQMVMHTDKASTFASAEAFFAAHNRITVGKWQANWTQKLDEFVLDGAGPLFVQFDNRILEAAPLKDRALYFSKALGSGGSPPWMTQNEVRAEHNLPPLPGGDELFKPTNAVIDQTDKDENDDA